MAANHLVQACIDESIKKEAAAVRLLLTKIAHEHVLSYA